MTINTQISEEELSNGYQTKLPELTTPHITEMKNRYYTFDKDKKSEDLDLTSI